MGIRLKVIYVILVFYFFIIYDILFSWTIKEDHNGSKKQL